MTSAANVYAGGHGPEKEACDGSGRRAPHSRAANCTTRCGCWARETALPAMSTQMEQIYVLERTAASTAPPRQGIRRQRHVMGPTMPSCSADENPHRACTRFTAAVVAGP